MYAIGDQIILLPCMLSFYTYIFGNMYIYSLQSSKICLGIWEILIYAGFYIKFWRHVKDLLIIMLHLQNCKTRWLTNIKNHLQWLFVYVYVHVKGWEIHVVCFIPYCSLYPIIVKLHSMKRGWFAYMTRRRRRNFFQMISAKLKDMCRLK